MEDDLRSLALFSQVNKVMEDLTLGSLMIELADKPKKLCITSKVKNLGIGLSFPSDPRCSR